MNTPTPRTDAAWAKTFDANGFLSGRGNAASQMRDECATLERELTARDDAYDELATDCAELRADVVRLTARAERAEANETVALARWNGALERAMKAEADLAALERCHDDNCRALVQIDAALTAERARLDSGTILLTVAGERVWHCGVDLRAAIDAALKEGAK